MRKQVVGEEKVEQITLPHGLCVAPLLETMERAGVLGAGALGRAFDLTVEMFQDPDYTVFLTLGGPMVAGGLRRIVQILLDKGLVDAVVTSGSNIVHDVTEALGFEAVKGSFLADDGALRISGIGRAGDIFFPQEGFLAFEKKTYSVLDGLSEARKSNISASELLEEYGRTLADEGSFVRTASLRGAPIFAPALLDSMLGFHIWTYGQLHMLHLDLTKDMTRLADLIYGAKKVGALILGGGSSKHFLLGANTLREGLDAAVQITLDRPEGGSVGGAPLEEAVSWKKAKAGRLITVVGDATMIFPFLVAGAMEKLGML